MCRSVSATSIRRWRSCPPFETCPSPWKRKKAAINEAQAYQFQTAAAARGQAAAQKLAAEGLAADRTQRAAAAARASWRSPRPTRRRGVAVPAGMDKWKFFEQKGTPAKGLTK